MLESHSRALKT